VLTFISKEQKKTMEVEDHPNKDLSTFIECGSATGVFLPFLAIFKGQAVLEHWFVQEPGKTRLDLEKLGHCFATSPKGWSSNELAVFWLKHIFLPNTKPSNPKDWRLLICDGHGSHATPEFRYICFENRVQVLYLASHSSHKLQPLDVSVFGPLKHFWRQAVTEMAIFMNSTPVCKRIITSAYPKARREAFTPRNMRSGFKRTGIYPFCPEVLLDALPQRQQPVICESIPITSIRIPLAEISANSISNPASRDERSAQRENTILRAENTFLRSYSEQLNTENSILRKPKVTKRTKRNLNKEVVNQAEVYDEAAQEHEDLAAEIRKKAAKFRKNKENKENQAPLNNPVLSNNS
jgi:hypothetical protein